MKHTNITILGGGFAGLAALNTLKTQPNLHITLVNNTNHFLFTPLLPEVTTGRLAPTDISVPLKQFCDQKNIELIIDTATAVDFDKQTLSTQNKTLSYDYLIASPGSLTNFFNVAGACDHCFVLKSLEDAKLFREHCQKHVAEGSRCIAIVGGGPTGVEVAADLRHALEKTVSKDVVDQVSIELFQRGDSLLQNYPKKIQHQALLALQNNGVTVHLNTPVTAISKDGVGTPNGIIHSDCILWATGIKPQLFELAPAATVLPTLQMESHSNVFVAGDSALLTYPGTEQRVPALAQIAEAQGTLAAKNILRLLKGSSLKVFTKRPDGILVSLGHNLAGGQIGPIAFTGRLASIFWKLVYASKMPTMKKKFGLLKKWFF